MNSNTTDTIKVQKSEIQSRIHYDMGSSSNIVERDHRKERETKIKRIRDEILEIIKNAVSIAKDWCKIQSIKHKYYEQKQANKRLNEKCVKIEMNEVGMHKRINEITGQSCASPQDAQNLKREK